MIANFTLTEFHDAVSKKQHSRDQLVYMARLAETAERYDDMCEFMKQLVLQKVPAQKPETGAKEHDLSVEERNLLSVAYKNVIGARRASWRTLQIDDTKNEESDQLVKTYKRQIENELENICKQVLSLLNDRLLVVTKNNRDESEVFYLKMAADYYRYLAEFKPTEENLENAKNNYQQALDIASQSLESTHPIRLGLALNFSVCYYEILKKPQEACNLAKTAFDEAIKDLDSLDEASYKDSTLIMQLLRDNLTLWTQSDDQLNKDMTVEDVEDR